MPTLFRPLEGGITYVKTYSTFRNNTTENCLALVLLPNSKHRDWASLQSIQFDFDIQGTVPALTVRYQGRDEDIQKKADETLKWLNKLESAFGKEKCSRFMFNKKNKSLIIVFIPSLDTATYFSQVFDIVTMTYFMQESFAKDLKDQLLNRDYLAKEFMRLGGRTFFKQEVLNQISCSIS